MWGEGKKRLRFHKAELRETSDALHNPGCGWYHVYTFSAAPPRREEVFYLAVGGEDEQLVLLLMDIGAFQQQELSEDALSYVESVLRFFQENNKKIILRFAYDTEGKGAEREPQSISLVKWHMEQLGGIIKRYAADILVLQGIFVGNWGEMHGSKFLYQKAMVDLLNTLYQATEGSCPLAVRTPAQWRSILSSAVAESALETVLTVFNDGIFGSSTDLGTYGIGSRQEAGELNPWSREEELCWQSQQLRGKPNGGEALWGDPPVGYEQAAEEMGQMHLSYLNSVHDSRQLDYWKEETVKKRGCWNGLSGYVYIGRHLGYRFVVRDVQLIKKTFLEITIENCGFAELCAEAECALLLENEEGTISSQIIDTDPRNWESGMQTVLRIPLLENQKRSQCRVFLQLKEKSNGGLIRFANETGGERVMLGAFK